MTANILDVKNLSLKINANPILTDISFQLKKGDIATLIGGSGSGKSSLAKTIVRLFPSFFRIQTEGNIVFNNVDLTHLSLKQFSSYRGREIALIFQDPGSCLNPTLSIEKQMTEAMRYHFSLPAKALRERALEMLNLAGIDRPYERLKQYPHELSGGIKQRVMIASALLCEPKLLLADEPTASLDAIHKLKTLELFQTLQTKLDISILFITHDFLALDVFKSQILVMQNGKLTSTYDIKKAIELQKSIDAI